MNPPPNSGHPTGETAGSPRPGDDLRPEFRAPAPPPGPDWTPAPPPMPPAGQPSAPAEPDRSPVNPNWSPPDAGWAPPPAAARVAPTASAATAKDGRWRPVTVVVLVVIVALTFTGALWAASPPPGPPGGNAVVLVGEDGYAEVQTDGEQFVQAEWAHLSGPRAFSGPFEMYYVMQDMPIDEAVAIDWVRLTRTTMLGEQTHRLYSLSEDGLRLHVETETPLIHYAPGRLELPAGVTPGAEWLSEGQVDGEVTGDYRTVGHAADASNFGEGCLRVELTETIGGAEATTSTKIWCPGRGSVEDDGWVPGSLEPAPRGNVERDWQPESWTLHQPEPMQVDGGAPLVTTPLTAPLGTDGHSIAVGTSQDVVTFDQNWLINGVSHAGGQITTATQVGDLTITANSNRTITAVDPRYWRRWQIRTSDVSNQLIPVGADRFISSSYSGAVTMHSADTGEVLWEVSFPSAGERPITVDGDRIYLASGAEEATVLDLATGDTLATVPVPEVLNGIGGGSQTLVVYGTSGRVWAHDPDGTTRWEATIADNVGGGQIVVTDRAVIVGGDNGVYALDLAAGDRLWFTPEPAEQLVTDGDTLVVYSDSHLAVYRDGQQLHYWPRPNPLLVSDFYCRALFDGVTCINGNGEIVEARP